MRRSVPPPLQLSGKTLFSNNLESRLGCGKHAEKKTLTTQLNSDSLSFLPWRVLMLRFPDDRPANDYSVSPVNAAQGMTFSSIRVFVKAECSINIVLQFSIPL